MKRIYIKKGDVFCINIDNKEKVFFQFIITDITQLNSCVIRVFKKNIALVTPPLLMRFLKMRLIFMFILLLN